MNPIYAVPISVKGIVFEDDRVWLRKNEREEWELPGGKLDEGEQPTETVVREMEEELGLEVVVTDLIHAHLYQIKIKQSNDESRGVLVITYLCAIIKRVGDFEHEGEAGPAEFKAFTTEEIGGLQMPDFYREAIRSADFARKIDGNFKRL